MAPTPPDLFARIYIKHGHRCPMSTLGGRLGLAARRRGGAGELRLCYQISTCAVDGILLGCGEPLANGVVRLVERGRHALQLQGGGGAHVELSLSAAALDLAGRYRLADLELERRRVELTADELQKAIVAKGALLDELLPQLWSLPEEQLIDAVALTPEELL